MKKTGILLVGYGAIDAKIATEVARMAFPRAVVKTAANVEEAIASLPIGDADLLVLSKPNPTDLTKAMETIDTDGLPRWAVVVVAEDPAPLGAESIGLEEWAGPVTAHAFRSALSQHALRRDLARARGDLAAIGVRITHDLRTQVAGILATAELSKEFLAEVEHDQAELYEPIFDSVDSLGKLIERLSFLTQASTNGTIKTTCAMKDAISSVLARLAPDIAARGASIAQPDRWPEIIGSKPYLEKIWLNLISNALTHTEESPKIELGWTKEKNEYRFWIHDKGKGAPPPKRDQLFQPFHLLHRPGSARGLGLPIVRRLTEIHGGRCGYSPLAQGGSEFYFTLPT